MRNFLACLRSLASPPLPPDWNLERRSVFSRRNCGTHARNSASSWAKLVAGMVGGTSSLEPTDSATRVAKRASPSTKHCSSDWSFACACGRTSCARLTSSGQDPTLIFARSKNVFEDAVRSPTGRTCVKALAPPLLPPIWPLVLAHLRPLPLEEEGADCQPETPTTLRGAGLRLDGIPALDSWALIVAVLGNTNQSHKER